jgi:5-methylcytosine-specific restriction endonuclease McrA
VPTTAKRPCRYPGCSALTAERNGLCAQHQGHARASAREYDATTRKDDPALAFAATVRSSARWRCVRTLHKAQEPLCRDPFGTHAKAGLPAYNEQSHHITSLAAIYALGPAHYELAYDLANLAGLCTACHARVERMERGGGETRAMFAPNTGNEPRP